MEINWDKVMAYGVDFSLADADEKKRRNIAFAVVDMLKDFPNVWNDWEGCLDLPYEAISAGYVAKEMLPAFGDDEESRRKARELSETLFRIGTFLWQRAQHRAADRVLTLSIVYAEKKLGNDPEAAADARRRSGRNTRFMGMLEQALELQLASKAFCESENAEATDENLYRLASVLDELCRLYLDLYQREGQDEYLENAKQSIRRALNLFETLFGTTHFEWAISARSLANVHRFKGEHIEAWQLLEKILPILREHFGNGHMQIGITYRLMGLIRNEMEQHETASKYFEAALEIFDACLPPNHPEKAVTKLIHAQTLRRLGKIDQARGMEGHAKEMLKNEDSGRDPSIHD